MMIKKTEEPAKGGNLNPGDERQEPNLIEFALSDDVYNLVGGMMLENDIDTTPENFSAVAKYALLYHFKALWEAGRKQCDESARTLGDELKTIDVYI